MGAAVPLLVFASSPSPTLGPLLVAAALLGVAGVEKLRRPAPTGLAMARLGLPGRDPVVRALGAVEVAAAVASAALGGWLAAPVAVLYVGFAAVSAAQLRRARTTGEASTCGCFGDSDAPVDASHVVVDLLLAGAAVAAVVVWTAGLVGAGGDAPGTTLAVAALAVVGAAGVRALLTDVPVLRALRAPTEAAS